MTDSHDNQFAKPAASPSARRAKIVCTIGPTSNNEEMMRELMLSGMDVARLNFSHGTHEKHASVIQRLRKVAEQELVRRNVLHAGDIFGLIAGTINSAGATNFMRLIAAGG